MKTLFRVDASRRIGIGHLRRCLALAEALRKRGCDPIFLTKDFDKMALSLIKHDGFNKVELMESDVNLDNDLAMLRSTAVKYRADFVIADSYSFDDNYYRKLKSSGLGLLVIDDLAEGRFTADIVLNQNICAEALDYPAKTEAKLLLGPRYALLKNDFAAKKDSYHPSGQLKKILIMLGGGINKNTLVIKIIKAVSSIKGHKFDIRVIAKIEPRTKEAIKKVLKDKDISYKLKGFSNNIFEDMLWADLVICGGGSTTYELCSLGVPFMTFVLAPNQRLNAESLEKGGVSINLGWHKASRQTIIRDRVMDLMHGFSKRAKMSRRGRSLVDGLGAGRVAEEILY